MEMTTVSPSPASPTEGDDLCEIDGTNVAIHSVTLLISLCGLVGNGAVLCLLSLKVRNTGIFELAFADFFFLLFTVPSALLLLVEDVSCSPIMPLQYLTFLFQLPVVVYYMALLWLMYSSSNGNVFKLCMRWCRCHLPEHLLWLLFSVPYWALIALVAVIPVVTNMRVSREHEKSRAALILFYTAILLSAAATVIVITINFVKAKRGSQQQQPKWRHIIFLLIVLFILLLMLRNFLQEFGYTFVSSEVFLLLNCIHSSIKPFIYFLAGRCWSPCSLRTLRLSLRRVFDEQEEDTDDSNDAPMEAGV